MVGHARQRSASREHGQLTFETVRHDVTDDVAEREADFYALFQAAVRAAILPYAQPGREAQFVRDVLRPDAKDRRGFRSIKRLAEIAARGNDPSALGNALNDFTRRRVVRAVASVHEAIERATVEASEAQVALHKMHRSKTPQSVEEAKKEVREAAYAHEELADTLNVVGAK